MQSKSTYVGCVILAAVILSSPIVGQDARVEVSKHLTAIPKACASVSPALIENTVDVEGLVKEAICKGAGDMLTEYTYVMTASSREQD